MADHARSIEHLVFSYAERLDAGDFDGTADLFRHGRIAAAPDAGPDGTFEGPDAVRAMYANSVKLYEATGTPQTRHLTTNVIVELGETVPDLGAASPTEGSSGEDTWTATSRSYYTVLQQTDTLALAPIISGRYHDTFHRVEGRWWFETRIMIIDAVGDLSQHLTFDL